MVKKKRKVSRGKLKGSLEPVVAQQLKKIKGKTKVTYETTNLPYVLEKNYWPDWGCVRPDGSVFYLEAKGYFRPQDRVKLLAVKKLDPSLDIRLIFGYDNKISSKSNMRYSDWCERHGFPYCIKELPKDWFE